MSATAAIPVTTLPTNVLKLDPTGLNWVIYHIRFTCAVKSKGVWEHLNRSSLCSDQSIFSDTFAAWEKDEAYALDLLTQCIPYSTVICIMKLKSVAEIWAEIVKEYTEKGTWI
jgi:hypothetical protein